MQYGIWMEYCRQTLNKFFEQPEHPSEDMDLREDMMQMFSETEQLIDEQ